MIYLLGVTRPTTTWERIENRLYMSPDSHMNFSDPLPLRHTKTRAFLPKILPHKKVLGKYIIFIIWIAHYLGPEIQTDPVT